MTGLVDGVAVASAALAEVGIPGIAFRSHCGRVSTLPAGRDTYRAALLGLMAERGADLLVRCEPCAFNGFSRGTTPCTPARDALRGVTCGRPA